MLMFRMSEFVKYMMILDYDLKMIFVYELMMIFDDDN
jgi:hypothetical protein